MSTPFLAIRHETSAPVVALSLATWHAPPDQPMGIPPPPRLWGHAYCRWRCRGRRRRRVPLVRRLQMGSFLPGCRGGESRGWLLVHHYRLLRTSPYLNPRSSRSINVLGERWPTSPVKGGILMDAPNQRDAGVRPSDARLGERGTMDHRPQQSGPAKPVIDVQHLTKRFGALTAVDDVSFQVHEGEIFGFLGPNGAGKTTTMRMLCCLIAATSGDAHIGGYDIAKPADSLPIRRLIGLIPDNVGLYDELSAYDNLDFYGKLYDCPQPARETNIEKYLTLLGLWDERDRAVGSFSKGMKQKVAVARALIHDPTVLFLDEPTANLDPESSKVVTDVILQLRRVGKTIFLNTHNLDEAQRICDRIGILKTKLLTVSTPEALRTAV